MSKSNVLENDWLKLLFLGTAIANIADNAASSPLTNLYVSLHTADPGEAGDQTTSEISYTGYARQPVARPAGWTVTGNSVSPAASIDFPPMTAGAGGAITHVGVGTAVSGAGKLLYFGATNISMTAIVGFQPKIGTASAITED